MTESVNYSVTETEQLLRHALASSPRVNSERLALELGVAASRISEGLRGKWQLKEALKEKLIDEYGQPRGKPGQYVFAEVADTISDFLDLEARRSRERHAEKILDTLGNEDFLQRLALAVTQPDYSGSPRPAMSKGEVKAKLVQLERLFLSQAFSEWLRTVRQTYNSIVWEAVTSRDVERYFEASTYYDFDRVGEVPVPPGDLNLPADRGLRVLADKSELAIEGGALNALDLVSIGAVFLTLQNDELYGKAGLKKPFSLIEIPKREPLVERVEFVVTGDLIWEEQREFSRPKLGHPFTDDIVFQVPGRRPQQVISPTFDSCGRLEGVGSNKRVNWDVDYWSTYRARLFLKDNCNYSLVIELGSDELGGYHYPARNVVIPNISGRHVLDHLNPIREWLELDGLPEQTIKEEIARAGGYIPGARII